MSTDRIILFAAASAAILIAAKAQTPGTRARSATTPPGLSIPETIHVDPALGNDGNAGSQGHPLKSISAAVALLPDPLTRTVTIKLAPGTHRNTGGIGMAADRLELMRRMRPGVCVLLAGGRDDKGNATTLAWEGGSAMVYACEGDWRLENVQVGTGSTRQRRGVEVTGPAHVTLKNITFRTRSQSDAAIYATRGGKVSLFGDIRLNEHLHDRGGQETFSGIVATDHGLVEFRERENASLDIGNGSLSASYYGVIGLGCKTACITSWGEQSNTLAVNNSGRIDLHGTQVVLQARVKRNTPVGLEHDGHILGEDARVTIQGENEMAIALQKASTFTCNDIELRGTFGYTIWASSGSMFVGRFLGDVGRLEATTGANISIEQAAGKILGPVEAVHCGSISLPNQNVLSKPG
ncbi:MAG: hypothetical protein KA354_15030 [Phycisphaerae bacterium]|nr:hypothetical protein [Phycisphaerae bacterium]